MAKDAAGNDLNVDDRVAYVFYPEVGYKHLRTGRVAAVNSKKATIVDEKPDDLHGSQRVTHKYYDQIVKVVQ